MKIDEIELAKLILATKLGDVYCLPINMWDELTKRQIYILDKWTGKGLWDYGVSLRSGWLTLKGIDRFSKC